MAKDFDEFLEEDDEDFLDELMPIHNGPVDYDEDECPLSPTAIFGAMLNGEFTPMSDFDLGAYPNIGYNGFIGEVGGICVILDHGPGGVRVAIQADDESPWVGDLTGPGTFERED